LYVLKEGRGGKKKKIRKEEKVAKKKIK